MTKSGTKILSSFVCTAMFLMFAEIQGFNLECDFTGKIRTGKTCVAKNLSLTSPKNLVTSVNGHGESFYRSRNVINLSIKDQTVYAMPHGLELFFPHLNRIEIRRSKLKSIDKSDFGTFDELEKIILSNNQLEKVDNDLLRFNPRVQLMMIGNDRIEPSRQNMLGSLTMFGSPAFFKHHCINDQVKSRSPITKPKAILEVAGSEKETAEELKNHSAAYAIQGRRPYMEDRFVINENINGSTDISMFAVFDGHAGDFVADYAINVLVPNLCNKIIETSRINRSISNHIDVKKIPCDDKKTGPPKTYDASCYVHDKSNVDLGRLMKDEILAADHHIVKFAKKHGIRAGSTAHIAILDGTKLIVANVGDSRGVMCDFNGHMIPLSFDHKPENQMERKRIEAAGGFVAHHDVWRVIGRLAMSRALGDYEFKTGMVIADPDILSFDLAEHNPQFLILATDGLWDTFSNKEAVAYIREHLDEPDFGAKSLTLESYARGSSDNIATIVIVFHNGFHRIGSSAASFEY